MPTPATLPAPELIAVIRDLPQLDAAWTAGVRTIYCEFENPKHYPFAFSDNPLLQWVNAALIKAKPEMHKRTFLKPEVHRGAEFCSTCHKVFLPEAVIEVEVMAVVVTVSVNCAVGVVASVERTVKP
mgnify:CR=1 FL=1